MASSVEQEIWNIFTFYTLHGNPLDPEHIRATQFVKLCKDCQVIGSTLSEADPPLTEADVQVCYTAEVKRIDREKGSLQKMNYNDFLTALMKLSIKVYPRSKTVDEAFQRLLMDNLLPLAARRAPVSVEPYLENEDMLKLFDYYGDALEQIFQFYATGDKRTQRAMVQQAVASGSISGAFSTSALTVSGRSPGRATRASNSMKEALGYQEFLKFASDFDLSSSVILSTLEIGDIFLSSIKAVEPDSTIRKLTFMEFWEAMVRCALVAYSKISDATIIDRIRGLFLYMWRAINRSVPRAFSERRNVSTYAGDLLSGAMLFNKRFTAAWAADGYRDYLSPDATPLESGKAVLNRLLKKGQQQKQQQASNNNNNNNGGFLSLTGTVPPPPEPDHDAEAEAMLYAQQMQQQQQQIAQQQQQIAAQQQQMQQQQQQQRTNNLSAAFYGTPQQQQQGVPQYDYYANVAAQHAQRMNNAAGGAMGTYGFSEY